MSLVSRLQEAGVPASEAAELVESFEALGEDVLRTARDTLSRISTGEVPDFVRSLVPREPEQSEPPAPEESPAPVVAASGGVATATEEPVAPGAGGESAGADQPDS